MKHNAIQSSLPLRDIARTPRKRKEYRAPALRSMKPDEQNKQLSLHLIPWMIEKHPLELLAMMAQPEQAS